MTFLRRKWQQKPKQRGPFSAVQSALFHNLENIGIDPDTIAFAMPMWNPGKQYDYAKNNTITSASYPSFIGDKLNFSANDYLSVDKECLQSSDFSIIWRSRVDASNSGYFFSDSITVTNLFYRWNLAVQQGQIGATTCPNYTDATLKNVVIDDALTLDSGTAKLFVNSEFKVSTTGHSFSGLINNLYIGNRAALDRDFLGDFHYFLIFNKALSDDLVALLHDNPWQLWQPVPQKTIFLPLESGALPINLTGELSFSGSLTRQVIYNRSVEGEF